MTQIHLLSANAAPQPHLLSFNRHHFFISLKLAFLPVYSSVVLSLNIDQQLNNKIESLVRSQEGFSHSLWLWGGLSLTNSLVLPVVITLLCCFFIIEKIKGHSANQIPVFFRNHFELTLLESIRAWAYMFLWFFAFILPMIYKFISYAMTPFVVIYSKKYATGTIDALQCSQQISREFFFKQFFILLFFYVFFPLLSTLIFDEYKIFNLHPVSASIITLIDTVIIFSVHFLLLNLFFNSSQTKGEIHAADI